MGGLLFNFFQTAMTPVTTLKNTSVAQIDFTDFSYSLSPLQQNVPDGVLAESIARYGMLHPPIIRDRGRGSYAIVAGRKRLLALRSLTPEGTCNCLLISPQVPESEVFGLLLAEICLNRHPTPVETAIFLKKTAELTDDGQPIPDLYKDLASAASPPARKKAMALLELEEPILLAVHRGNVTETAARALIPLSVQDRTVLFEIISSLKPSASNQKKLIDICTDLAGRWNTSITTLIDNEDVRRILRHKEANPPQKTRNLMTWLSRKHMPRSSQAEEEFNRFIAAMHLPDNVSVAHTPYFEDEAVTLSVTFRSRRDLQAAWEKIRHEAKDGS